MKIFDKDDIIIVNQNSNNVNDVQQKRSMSMAPIEETITKLEDIIKQLNQLDEQNKQKEEELKKLRVENWELEQKLEVQRKETEKWKQISLQQNKR